MPSRNHVQKFIDRVVSGDHVGAIEDFYHADASMQENDNPPRYGRYALIDHERQASARIQAMQSYPPELVVVDGDHVVIGWTFDMVDQTGTTRRLEEIALQHWSGDRIHRERFIYDSARAWRKIADSQNQRIAS